MEFFKEKALSYSRKVTLYDMYNTQRHGNRKNGKITATTFVDIIENRKIGNHFSFSVADPDPTRI